MKGGSDLNEEEKQGGPVSLQSFAVQSGVFHNIVTQKGMDPLFKVVHIIKDTHKLQSGVMNLQE